MQVLIVSDLLKKIDTIIDAAARENVVKITDAISPVFIAATGLYVVYIAYRIIVTQQETVMSDVIKNIALFAMVSAVIASNGYYTENVIPFVMHAGQDLTTAITGVDAATAVDQMWDKLSQTMLAYLDDGLENAGAWSVGVALGNVISVYSTFAIGMAGGIILILLICVYLAVSTFMIGLLLSVGVIFFCFAVFPSTRSMFTSWTGNCLNYIMLNVLYSVAFSIFIEYIEKEITFSYTKYESFDTAVGIKMLLIVLICGFVITQIGAMCSSLTGGVGINGLVSSVGSGLRMGGKAVSKAGELGRKAGGMIKNLLNRGKGKIQGG